MIRPIVIHPEAILRQRGKRIEAIDDEIKTLAEDLIETMRAAHGIGLAAQQIGVAKQIAVVDVSHDPSCFSILKVNGKDTALESLMPLVFLNPKLTPKGSFQGEKEGCLSFPDLVGTVNRKPELTAELTLLDGSQITLETDGLLARAIQHETDHLNGLLFIDRMSQASKVRIRRKIKNYRGGSWTPQPEEDLEE